jgi:hypothetical protein
MEEAGAFRRAAMLSLAAIGRWTRPDGTGYIVKNCYPIETRFGYEGYSQHTTYNMLGCSMLAAAWQFADPAIPERPAPADIGGFVVPVLEVIGRTTMELSQLRALLALKETCSLAKAGDYLHLSSSEDMAHVKNGAVAGWLSAQSGSSMPFRFSN